MRIWHVTLLTMLLAVGAAWAQPGPKGGNRPERPRFGNADLNEDGTVDEVEAEQAAKQRIDRIKTHLENIRKRFDTNGDGTLDENEKTALDNAMAERGNRGRNKMFAAIDANHDLALDADEEAAALEKLADHLKQAGTRPEGRGERRGPQDPDANGDCIIDETEARVAAERQVDMMRRLVARLAERAQDNPDMRYPPRLAEIDADQNYDISDAEAKAAVEHIMEQMTKRNEIVLKYYDENQDGSLNDEETAKAQKAVAFMKEMAPPPARFGGRGAPTEAQRAQRRQGGRPERLQRARQGQNRK